MIPQVVAYASKGGWSMVLAQFDFAGSTPTVPRPSFAAGEPAVAARLCFRRAFEDDYAGAVLARGQGGTERRVAGSHHDDVVLRTIHRA